MRVWLALMACGTAPQGAAPAADLGPTQPLSSGPLTIQVPADWKIQGDVAKVPASTGRCTVSRLPASAARDFEAVKRSADKLVSAPPDGVDAAYVESPLGEMPGVELTMKNSRMKGDWRSVQRMLVVQEGCVAVVQCSGSPFPDFESRFRAVLATVTADPAGCGD